MYDPYVHVKSTELGNGVKVYVLEVPGCQFAYFDLLFGIGAMQDPQGLAGLAHFVEHMVCANSGLTVMEIENFFAEVGGSFNATTDWACTRYGFKAPVAHSRFDEGVSFWSKACLGNELGKHFEREKNIITGEFHQGFPSHDHAVFASSRQRLLFEGLSIAAAPTQLGALKSINTITLEDVQTFYRMYYVPDNLTVVCVGGLSLEAVCNKLQACEIGVMQPTSQKCLQPSITKLPKRSRLRLEADLVGGMSTQQSSLTSTVLVPNTVPLHALHILADMLSEHLFIEVREKRGLTYSAEVFAATFGAFHLLEFSVDDFDSRKLGLVERLIKQVLRQVDAQAALFEKMKARELARLPMVDAPWATVHEEICGDLRRIGRVQTMTESQRKVAALEFQDILQIRPYLSPRQFFTAVTHK